MNNWLNRSVREVSRQELYDKVWSTPMRTLATEYSLSDVGLAKLCKRHDIPTPTIGYWAKVEAGQTPPRPPLPDADTRAPDKVILPALPVVPTPQPEPTDPDLVQALARARTLITQATETPKKSHPVAERTLAALRKSMGSKYPGNRRGLLTTEWASLPHCIEVACAASSFDRVGRLLHRVLHRSDALGVTYTPQEDRNQRGLQFSFLGEEFRISLHEKVKQTPHRLKAGEHAVLAPRHDFEPRGTFELRLHTDSFHVWPTRSWKDRAAKPLDNVLDEMWEAIILDIDKARKDRAEAAKEQAKHREAERVRAEQQRVRDEEVGRIRRLFRQAEHWSASEGIRRFATAARANYETQGPIQAGSEVERWLNWVADVADRLDPLSAGPDQSRLSLSDLFPPSAPTCSHTHDSTPQGRPTWLGGWPNWRRS